MKLPGGVPSHDTFARVFAKLDARAFERGCLEWLRTAADLVGLGHIAIDGKTVRGSAGAQGGPLHLVSAWATQANLILGQVAVEGKSNEITAIPKLLELLDLQGALVTIDAIGCQKEIVKKIRARGGDYVLAVKGNQERLLDDIRATVGKALEGELPAATVKQFTSEEDGHGRHEYRNYTVIDHLEHIRDRQAWEGLTTVGMCLSERTVAGQTSSEVHYFIGSRKMTARKYAQTLRGHWRIENNLHWQLDVSFREDASRLQESQAATNFAVMRKMGLCLLKQNSLKDSIARKRKKAAINLDFLEETLAGAEKLVQV